MSLIPEELELETNESDDELYYKDIYFDSDLDNETGEVDKEQSNLTEATYSIKKQKSRKKLTEEELFYDSKMDDDDELWMKKKMAPIFVENCKVNRSERLIYTDKENVKARNKNKNKRLSNKLSDKQKQQPNSTEDATVEMSGTTEGEIYYPVECEICGTKVAVVDEEEVYHFFNVIPS
ncbi:24709_t:CDS:2 [Cetraspora pellucida]|uniref:24709_t:CDS:1 n=1 Tax=Cetraspora pellucida TaxID=1433469 RepID=A0A9N8WBR7_9GLOM|nr:24709_t:CDS:2 [Cetraspora pellucida]